MRFRLERVLQKVLLDLRVAVAAFALVLAGAFVFASRAAVAAAGRI